MGSRIVELVDTNVILRFLLSDNLSQQARADRWFSEAKDNQRLLSIKVVVIAEVCFVLEKSYKMTRPIIAKTMEAFLSPNWLTVDDRDCIQALWQDYIQGFHFVDSYLLAWANINHTKILSFDKKLTRKST